MGNVYSGLLYHSTHNIWVTQFPCFLFICYFSHSDSYMMATYCVSNMCVPGRKWFKHHFRVFSDRHASWGNASPCVCVIIFRLLLHIRYNANFWELPFMLAMCVDSRHRLVHNLASHPLSQSRSIEFYLSRLKNVILFCSCFKIFIIGSGEVTKLRSFATLSENQC